jgi:hypothetical protein
MAALGGVISDLEMVTPPTVYKFPDSIDMRSGLF